MSKPAKNAKGAKTPTLAAQGLVIREHIKTLRRSYSERDGVVREPRVIEEIRCLEATQRLLKMIATTGIVFIFRPQADKGGAAS